MREVSVRLTDSLVRSGTFRGMEILFYVKKLIASLPLHINIPNGFPTQ